jgi:hypothetical protein
MRTSLKTLLHLKNTILPVFNILFVFLFSSCEHDLNVEIKTNDKRLLVDGEFTNDSVIHTIKLYCSGSLLTGKTQTAVSGAKVFVTDNTDTFYYAENVNTPGLYETLNKCRGIGGKVYFLSITNIDVDKDGEMDSYTAYSMMPVPVKFDSLVSIRGLDGDGNMAVNNYAYYKIMFNGPDFVYKYTMVNNQTDYGTITDRLGSGEINRFENESKIPHVNKPDSTINYWSYLSIESKVVQGDTIAFICYNYTNDQFEFLKAFDNNTSSNNQLEDNYYDQLKLPINLPTNIEPSDKAAGYFFIYSVSGIAHVFKDF